MAIWCDFYLSVWLSFFCFRGTCRMSVLNTLALIWWKIVANELNTPFLRTLDLHTCVPCLSADRKSAARAWDLHICVDVVGGGAILCLAVPLATGTGVGASPPEPAEVVDEDRLREETMIRTHSTAGQSGWHMFASNPNFTHISPSYTSLWLCFHLTSLYFTPYPLK